MTQSERERSYMLYIFGFLVLVVGLGWAVWFFFLRHKSPCIGLCQAKEKFNFVPLQSPNGPSPSTSMPSKYVSSDLNLGYNYAETRPERVPQGVSVDKFYEKALWLGGCGGRCGEKNQDGNTCGNNYAKLPCDKCPACEDNSCDQCTNKKNDCKRNCVNKAIPRDGKQSHSKSEGKHKEGCGCSSCIKDSCPHNSACSDKFDDKHRIYDKYDGHIEHKNCTKDDKYAIHFSDKDSCKDRGISEVLRGCNAFEYVSELTDQKCKECFPKRATSPNLIKYYNQLQGVCQPGKVSLRRDLDVKHVRMENNSRTPVDVAIVLYKIAPNEDEIPEPSFHLKGGEVIDLGLNPPGCPDQFVWLLCPEKGSVVNTPHIIPRHSNQLILNEGSNIWFITDYNQPGYRPQI